MSYSIGFEEKKKALKILFEKGFLTEEEYNKCVLVISIRSNDSDKKQSSPQKGKVLYSDDYLCISMQDTIKRNDDYLLINILVENKNSYPLYSVSARGISINDYVVESTKYLGDNIPGKMKTKSNIKIEYKDREDIGIYSINDIKEINMYFDYKYYEPSIKFITTQTISIDAQKFIQ